MSLVPSEFKLTTITGPPFIVVIVNWALFGILSIQVYLYSQTFPNDRKALKSLVYTVYLLETAQTILVTESAWRVLVSGFGNIAIFDEIGTTWLSVCCIGGLVGFLVQLFYAYRISVISQSRTMPGFIVLLSFISFGGAVATTVYAERVGRFSKLLNDETVSFTVIGVWGGTGSACDVVIAVCMCYYLRRRSRYGTFTETQALISRLVRMTIETGALTASVSTLALILFYSPSLRNTYFEAPLSAQAKLYSTTLLAVLNSRMKLGIVSESTSWRANELTTVLPRPRAMSGIKFASDSLSQSGDVFVTRGKADTVENAKQNESLGSISVA